MQNDVVLLYVTAPDAGTAERIGETVVEERTAACVNILPAMRAIYHWNDAIERSDEVVMIAKTKASLAETLKNRIEELHPYDTPCVLALHVDAGLSAAGYLNWLATETM